jgi:hypothetical protein
MSKCSKSCQYVFKQGKREGDKCGKPCRGDYCKDHNSHKTAYNKKYYEKKNEVKAKSTFKEVLRKFKRMSITKLKSMAHYDRNLKNANDDARVLIRRVLGIRYFLDPEVYQELIDEKLKNQVVRNINKIYIPYIGKTENAQAKLDELMSKRPQMIRKIKKLEKIAKIAAEKYEKYFEANHEYPENYY